QLYQLRGRVGRGANLAYAYFLYDRGTRLSPVAHQRLRTIYEATELGAGFTIAMKDLEIRGAGTILGPHQSGHISAVGFSLYTRLLAEAVEEQKALLSGKPKPPPRLPAPSIELPLDAFIPESYVADLDTRLELYRNLAEVSDVRRVEDIRREYTDRFGTPPPEVENLLYVVKIRVLAAGAGISSLKTEDGYIVLRRFGDIPFNAGALATLRRDGIEVGRTQIRLARARLGAAWQQALETVVSRLAQGSPVAGG
ncbi:MAG: transcription-repair coupling factor, partial [Dehalococcoidales bacterium]|nr:transcription-repair coupling factor [Dehalococcoidales bacterium]